MVAVPQQYQSYVDDAAKKLGVPPALVAAQINMESGWNPGAVSSAGAQGIAQFMPGTFAAYGSGSPFNVDDAFRAYVNYMRTLLNSFGGDTREALAAYNAGPANRQAGYGYADSILGAAGGHGAITATPAVLDGNNDKSGGGSGSGGNWWDPLIKDFNPSNWASSMVVSIGKAFKPLDDFFTGLAWITKPVNWLRIICGLFGFVFLIAGLIVFAGAV